MTCRFCKGRIRLGHRPGRFLAIAITAGAGAVVLAATAGVEGDDGVIYYGPGTVVMFIVLGLTCLYSMGGVWTEMVDASAWVYSKTRGQGVECDECGRINPIRPWSM